MTSHAPDPWYATEEYKTDAETGVEFMAVTDSSRLTVAEVYGPNQESRAQLIAAAPELLEALRKAERFLTIEFEHYQRKLRNATPDEEHLFQNAYDNFKTIVETISPAIAKAEGR